MRYALDIETAPTILSDKPLALEPYKIFRDECCITSVALAGPDGEIQIHHQMPDFHAKLADMLVKLEGCEVYCHYAIFDVGFMLASLIRNYPSFDVKSTMRKIKWRDTATLNKYLINGQKADELNISYSLADCVKRALKDHPDYEEFVNIKEDYNDPGVNWEYWLRRGVLDTRMTLALANKLNEHLKPEMKPGYLAVCSSIYPLAKGWITGINVDKDEVSNYEKKATARQKEILSELGIKGSQITSSPQLGKLLFETWGYKPINLTPKGKPSVNAESLIRLHQKHSDDTRIRLVMEYKKIATMLSKYIKGFKSAKEHLGEWKLYSSPRTLATITGRMTYSSKIKKKFQTSIALHQIPRKDKGVKRCMTAPPGYKVIYMDVSAQEGRFMAMIAPEPTMIRSYCNGVDLHSDLTEEIFGTPYNDIVSANNLGEPLEIVEQRQAGKLTGLSSFYRIGAPSLANKFFTTYEYDISTQTAGSYLRSFKRKYPGVPLYWDKAIKFARQNGYAEAIGGWRYRIKKLDWKGESSAINHPIQGSGAIQTYATIGVIERKWPETILMVQVHDALIYFAPEDKAEEIAWDIKQTMDKFNYGELLGFNQTVPIILDVAIGDNFSDLTNITTIKGKTND